MQSEGKDEYSKRGLPPNPKRLTSEQYPESRKLKRGNISLYVHLFLNVITALILGLQKIHICFYFRMLYNFESDLELPN